MRNIFFPHYLSGEPNNSDRIIITDWGLSKTQKLSGRHAIQATTAAKRRKDRQAATMTINEKCRTNCPAFCFDVGVDGFEPPTLCL